MAIQQNNKISLVGFSAAEQTMLELFFNGRQQKLFMLTAPDKANALLVDLSSATGEMQYLKLLRQHPGCSELPGIALVEAEDTPEKFLPLKRPLTLNALSEQLERLSQRLKSPETLTMVTASDRDSVFAEWQARKQAGLEAMQQWNRGKQLQDGSRKLFSLDRHGVQEVISKAHLVLAHRRQEVAVQEIPAVETVTDIKPVTPSADTVVVDTSPDYCGHLPDQDLNDPAGQRRIRFNLERSLLPWVVQAVKTGRQTRQAQQVSGLPGVLIYLPAEDSFFCDLDEDLLLHMARAKFALGELSLVACEVSAVVQQETVRHIVADKLLWKLALLTSRGRLPEGIDLNRPLQLIRKPDFAHFERIPHARTLAELWYSKRLSPVQMLSELAVPQRYVFTFLVAADAVGYFNP